jgi:hypothetical protein
MEDIAHNIMYYFIGRFGGILPYFFPAVLAMFLFFIFEPKSLVRWILFLGAGAAAMVYIVMIPTNVIGGGGTVANRYFMNILPLFFFLLPRKLPSWTEAVAVIGGFLFAGHIILNPLFHSRFPSFYAENPVLKMLPVEFTMLNDLPVRTDSNRSRMEWFKVRNGKVLRDEYGPVIDFYTYQLDHNSYEKEPNPNSFYVGTDGQLTRDLITEKGTQQIWTKGGKDADIVIRTGDVRASVKISITNCSVENDVELTVHGQTFKGKLKPREKKVYEFKLGNTFEYHYLSTSYLYSVRVKTTHGATPRTRTNSTVNDWRYLGVMLEFDFE